MKRPICFIMEFDPDLRDPRDKKRPFTSAFNGHTTENQPFALGRAKSRKTGPLEARHGFTPTPSPMEQFMDLTESDGQGIWVAGRPMHWCESLFLLRFLSMNFGQ